MDIVQQQPGAAALQPLSFGRRTGALIGLGARNALLTLLTLGIWRFWARTRTRQAIWPATTLFGDRLEYTGTGSELFRGFLAGLLVFLPLVLASLAVDLFLPRTILGDALSIGLGLCFIPPALLGRYAARRYVASRTRWRGIRFHLAGSPWRYALRQSGWFLLTLLTLGLAYPFQRAAEARWMIGRLRLGDLAFTFDGTGRQILWPFLAATAVNLLIGLGIAFALASTLGAWFRAADPTEGPLGGGELNTLYVYIPVLALFMFLGPARLWFNAVVMRWQAAHTRLAGARFSMEGATTIRVARLLIGDALMRLFGLGVLGPLVSARRFGFHARHLRCDAAPDLSGVRQAEGGPRTGEGLEGLLGGDAFAG